LRRRIGTGRLSRARRPIGGVVAGVAILLGVPVFCAVGVRYLCGDAFPALDALFGLQPFRLLLILPGGVLCLLLRRRGPWFFLWAAGVCEIVLAVEAYRGIPLGAGSRKVPDDTSVLRVLTQNVNQEAPGPWAAWVRENKPDVACFQEVYTENLDAWKSEARAAGYSTHFQLLRKDAGMGTLIWCRWPLEACPPVEVWSRGGRRRWFAHARTEWNGARLDIFSIHLESAPRDAGIGAFLGSWRLRRDQAATVTRIVAECPSLVVVAGDINATPTDRSIRPLRAQLEDAWIMGGRGLGATWPAGSPVLRIDTVWCRGFAGAANGRVVKTAFSDHDGVAIHLLARASPSGGAP